MNDPTRLIVRRVIPADPSRLFEAWTTPSHLLAWWGPKEARCTRAEVDLRMGGLYRIDNRFADGRVVIITGEFLVIEAPTKLVYTWSVGEPTTPELVTVHFNPHDQGTEVVIVHERIADDSTRVRHERGWTECLEGLSSFTANG